MKFCCILFNSDVESLKLTVFKLGNQIRVII